MRLAPFIFSFVILGIPASLNAAKPARKPAHAAVAAPKARRGKPAPKAAAKHAQPAKSRVKAKGRAVAKAEPEEVPAAPAKAAVRPAAQAPVAAVPAIPSIRAASPAVLVHLERLLPANVDARAPIPVKRSALAIPPLTSQDLVPVFPSASGLEYGSEADAAFEPLDPDNLDLLWPVPTRRISSVFGPRIRTKTVRVVKARRTRRVLVKFQGSHKGVDLAAPMGSDVYAVADGKVMFSGQDKGYGNCVFIDHGNGIETRYAHHKLNLVHEGDIVRRGQKIAEVGTTGHSTGPHLHFELRLQGQAMNPMKVLNDVEEVPAEMIAVNENVRASED